MRRLEVSQFVVEATGNHIRGLAVPLLQGRVGRNVLYVATFKQAFASEEAWLAINRYGARRMLIWSLPILAVGMAVLAVPLATRPGLALVFGIVPKAKCRERPWQAGILFSDSWLL